MLFVLRMEPSLLSGFPGFVPKGQQDLAGGFSRRIAAALFFLLFFGAPKGRQNSDPVCHRTRSSAPSGLKKEERGGRRSGG